MGALAPMPPPAATGPPGMMHVKEKGRGEQEGLLEEKRHDRRSGYLCKKGSWSDPSITRHVNEVALAKADRRNGGCTCTILLIDLRSLRTSVTPPHSFPSCLPLTVSPLTLQLFLPHTQLFFTEYIFLFSTSLPHLQPSFFD